MDINTTLIKLFISIHSLRVEGDTVASAKLKFKGVFQSTPSVWRETASISTLRYFPEFQSTPSVWRETAVLLYNAKAIKDFNPLPPCGGRP